MVLYNGICYKLIDHVWHEVTLEGSEAYFTRAYLSMPYEKDANAFAYDSVRKICGDTMELKRLYDFWTPKQLFDYRECRELFSRIDHTLLKKRISNDLK